MARELVWFELRFPRELDESAVTAALSALSGVAHGTRLILELSATSDGIGHRLAISSSAAEILSATMQAAIPSLRLDSTKPPASIPRRAIWQLSPAVATLRTDQLGALSANLLAGLSPLRSREQVRLRWHLRPSLRPRLDFQAEGSRGGRTLALRHKLALPGLSGYGELLVRADDRQRVGQLVQRVATALRSLNTPHGRLIADPFWFGQLLRLLGRRGRYFSVNELAAVIGWPVDGPDLPGLELGASKRLVPNRQLASQGRLLGVSDYGGLTRPVAITPTASTRGLYVLGPTGTGKTSLLKNLIRDDMAQGRGLVAIETNGDLIRDLLDLVAPNRIEDVILLDPTDQDYAVGFNPFAGSADPSLVADQINELFRNLWERFWGPRTGQLAHMGLLTLARHENSTLLDLARLYQDPAFRSAVLRDLDDPVGLGPDWRWFDSLGDKQKAEVVSPLLNKARQFVARPSIRVIVGQPEPTITMRRVMAEQKILLVNLPKGLIGAETAQLLGCLILTSLWQAATERAGLATDARQPFGLYVDEVQDFAAAPIPWDEMFAQGRKYALALTVAHQNLSQLPKELREVILANARSKVVFALSAADARVMERHFAPALSAADLQALDAHSIAALVALDNGSTARPVTLLTPSPPPSCGSAAAVQKASRASYARRRQDIEASLRHQAQTAITPVAPIGRKARGAP